MSKSIKVQLSKSIHNSKLDILLNSYISLKSILSPNLSDNNNIFMTSLIDLIISQLKIFVRLLSLNEEKKVYEILNSNNQNLSKQIASLYEIPRYQVNAKLSLNSTSEKEHNRNNRLNNKESYSLEEKKESVYRKNSDNFEFNFNKLDTESKEVDNGDYLESKNNNIDESQNNYNKLNSINLNTNNTLLSTGTKDKFMKLNKNEKEKNDLVRSLNFNNSNYLNNKIYKEKEKINQIKSQINVKKLKQKIKSREKDFKIQFKKNIFLPNSSKSKKYLNNSKNIKFEYPSFKIENKLKNNFSKKGMKDKEKSLNKKRIKKLNEDNKKELLNKVENNYNNLPNDYIEEQINDNNESEKNNYNTIENNIDIDNNNIKDNINDNNSSNKKFKRKDRKSKTVLYQAVQIPYFIGIETSENDISPEDNYFSITFSNRMLDRLKTPKGLNYKKNFINIKNNEGKSSSNKEIKRQTHVHLKSGEHFSLDQFLIPHSSKNGEKLFLTKKGKVLINKKQKDILEDYVNNYLFDEEDAKSSATERDNRLLHNKKIQEALKNLKDKKNKHFVIKGTSQHYNLKDVTELLQILPDSFKIPIDDFYLRKKKASIFDRGIFKICHKVIDNYKILEGKENIFKNKKSKSKSKYNTKTDKKSNYSNKSNIKYQNRNDGLYNKNLNSN